MDRDHLPIELDPAARHHIRQKVRHLIGRAGLTAQDREDLEQQLQVEVLQRLRKLKPGRASRNKLLATIIKRCSLNLLRDRRAAKRDYRRLRSLHARAPTPEGTRIELAQTLGQDAHDARLRWRSRNDQEQADLAMDLAEALARLPAELRDLAEQLRDRPLAEIARERGVPRSTLNEVRLRLRRCFEKAGLRDHL